MQSSGVPRPVGKVVLSEITHGAHAGTRFEGTGIKYVGRGTEHYVVADRRYTVNAGQFLCMAQSLDHVGEVPRTGDRTLGLCMFLPAAQPTVPTGQAFEKPLIFSADASPLGRLLRDHLRTMMRPTADRPVLAGSLLDQVGRGLAPLMIETLAALDALPGLKASTRYENLRRLHLARAYLHDVTDRAVDLPELAAHAGMSRFQLLRYFRDCFGTPPAAYHRRLRLRRVRDAVERDGLTWAQAAQRCGFPDGSSLSHAYKRAFGCSPARAERHAED